jgi:hypothetical protein
MQNDDDTDPDRMFRGIALLLGVIQSNPPVAPLSGRRSFKPTALWAGATANAATNQSRDMRREGREYIAKARAAPPGHNLSQRLLGPASGAADVAHGERLRNKRARRPPGWRLLRSGLPRW